MAIDAKKDVFHLIRLYQRQLPQLLPFSLSFVLIIKSIFRIYGSFLKNGANVQAFFSLKGAGAFLLQTLPIILSFALMIMLAQHVIEKKASLKTFMHHAKPVLPSMLLGILVSGLLIYLGTLFVFFSLYAIVVLWFFPVEIIKNNSGFRQAFGQSYFLVSGRWWQMAHTLGLRIFIPLIGYYFLRGYLPMFMHTPLDIIAYSLFLPWIAIYTLATHSKLNTITGQKA